MYEGVDGLLCDKTRPPGKAPVSPEHVAEIVRLTQQPPPFEATHWTLRAMAKVAGVAASTVQAIWKAHGLSPHRWRRFKLSNDPAFAEKLTDIVGLYVNPPAHAVVLSVDEKSQIQALDRTQPGLPMKKGRAGTVPTTISATAPPPCSPRSTCWKARSSHRTCSVTAIRSSSVSSTPSSANTTPPTRNPSSGKPSPMSLSQPETEGSKRWNQSTSGTTQTWQDDRPHRSSCQVSYRLEAALQPVKHCTFAIAAPTFSSTASSDGHVDPDHRRDYSGKL